MAKLYRHMAALILAVVITATGTGVSYTQTTDGGADQVVGSVVRFSAGSTSVDLTIGEDNPTVRDFLSLLPLTMKLEEYAGREKIGYFSRKLATEGSPGSDPEHGDLIYFIPWGNIGFYYNTAGIGYSDQTIHIGKYNASLEQLEQLEGKPVRVERVQQEPARTIMIKDKVVIITGASSGIGEATAKLLAKKGAKVVLGARREDRLKRIADEITREGGQTVYQELDVTRQSDNDAIVKLAKETFGGVDVIFLNAGLMPNSPLSALKTDDWHQMVDVNIKGVLNGVAAVLPTFTEQKSGHVIATSSVAGLKAYPNGAVYGGTKWFVRDFMEVLRMESAMEGTNIRTATIYPAAINTELLATISDQGTARSMQNTYDKYGISPDRIANVVAFAIDQPEDTTVNEITVGPSNQPW